MAYEKEISSWNSVKEKSPPLGVPLMVKTYNIFDDIHEIKYPVYYVKDPYSMSLKWIFFPACEGISVLLPDYSDVLYWKELSFG